MKTHIFDKKHNEKGYEKILKWIDDEEVYPLDLMAIVCSKFAQVPEVKNAESIEDTTQIMLSGVTYGITIRKVK